MPAALRQRITAIRAAAVMRLQIEINRALYMDERRVRRKPELARLKAEMTALIAHLGESSARVSAAPLNASQRAAAE